ncbi:hypothetical protein DPX16_5544 [Anabarilius grahami]|uniref:Uncharacterized protein n=1 Tax=Anabarilius grahami TaxID=495550 RepID=A0A3N0YAM2_ANAGA|nr:hypothetical protein DPX16_5544 [Anabarilius grahami]
MFTVDVSQWLVDSQSFKFYSLTQMEKHRMKKLQLNSYSRMSQNEDRTKTAEHKHESIGSLPGFGGCVSSHFQCATTITSATASSSSRSRHHFRIHHHLSLTTSVHQSYGQTGALLWFGAVQDSCCPERMKRTSAADVIPSRTGSSSAVASRCIRGYHRA